METKSSEITRTLDWHQAVHTASVERFGEKLFRERITLAMKLIREESTELLAELERIAEFESLDDVPHELRAAALKESIDEFFVVLQAMYVLRVPVEEGYAEVLRSNWSKLNGGVRFRDDGKLLKSDAYLPADIEQVIRKHQEV